MLIAAIFPIGLAFQFKHPPSYFYSSRYMECVVSVGTYLSARRCINLHFSTVAAPERHNIIPDSFVEFHGKNERLESQTHDDVQSPGGQEITKPFSSLETRQTSTAANSRIENIKAAAAKPSDLSGVKFSRSDHAWMKKYQLLLEFRLENQQNQQCSPLLLVPTTDPTIGRWTQRQRSEYKRGEMATWRIKALDEVGFVWDVREYQRRLKLSTEEKYDNEQDMESNPVHNGNEHENGKKHSIAKRTNLKPKNDQNKAKKWRKLSWDERYAQLVDYHRVHGHVNVPLKDPINGSLGSWVQYQRRSRYLSKPNNSSTSKSKSATSSASKLTRDQVRKLEDLGFVWDLKQHRWMERYRELVDFVEKYGHCHVPSNGSIGKDDVDINDDGIDYKSLQAWCGTQRHLFRLKYKLDRTGKQHRYRVDDDCNSNDGCGEENEGYHAIVTLQSSKTSSPLTNEREALLNKINFDWDTNHSYMWNRRMEKLRQYKREHGHINLTKADDTNGAETEFEGLGSWLDTQRTEYRFKMNGLHTHLTDERVEELERLGIVWSIWDFKWNAKYEEVKKFYLRRNMLRDEAASAEFGCGVGKFGNKSHTIPTGLVHDGAVIDKLPPSLSVWLRDQKRFYKARFRGESTPLSDDRAEKLKMLLEMI